MFAKPRTPLLAEHVRALAGATAQLLEHIDGASLHVNNSDSPGAKRDVPVVIHLAIWAVSSSFIAPCPSLITSLPCPHMPPTQHKSSQHKSQPNAPNLSQRA